MSRRQFLKAAGLFVLQLIGLALSVAYVAGWLFTQSIPTSPWSVWDFTLSPILRVVWEPWSHKRSHWWQWRRYGSHPLIDLYVDGDPAADKGTSKWDVFANTNWRWQGTVELKPKVPIDRWQVGYISGDDISLCSLILTSSVRPLIGPNGIQFFGVDMAGHEIELVIVRQYEHRGDEPNIPIV